MGSVLKLECHCWRLSEPLTQHDQLPDHVCQETMMASVESAARAGAIVPMPDVWPVQIGHRRLGLVIRQWAEEEPNATLANLLEASPDWRQTLKSMAFYFGRWRKLHPDAEVDDWIWGSACHTRFTIELRRNQLPATPATVQYLRAVLAGASGPLPARGVLVTTKVYIQFHPKLGLLPEGSPESSLSEATEYLTGPLLGQAQRLILGHRDWFRQFRRNALTERRAVRRAQPGSFAQQIDDEPKDPSWYDYLAEALQCADDVLRLPAYRQRGLRAAISQHLQNVYRRVYKRRIDAGLFDTSQDGWREEAWRQLLQRFHNSR